MIEQFTVNTLYMCIYLYNPLTLILSSTHNTSLKILVHEMQIKTRRLTNLSSIRVLRVHSKLGELYLGITIQRTIAESERVSSLERDCTTSQGKTIDEGLQEKTRVIITQQVMSATTAVF